MGYGVASSRAKTLGKMPRPHGVETTEVLASEVVERVGEFARVVQEMRLRAGLTIPELAEGLGVSVGAVHQYLYRMRGDGGASTMRSFLRLAAVCRCEVTVRFPSARRG
jgi:hypothetical protein